MVALGVIITLAFSTVAIAQLHHAEGELSLDNVQASWIGMYKDLLNWYILGYRIMHHHRTERRGVVVSTFAFQPAEPDYSDRGFPQR